MLRPNALRQYRPGVWILAVGLAACAHAPPPVPPPPPVVSEPASFGNAAVLATLVSLGLPAALPGDALSGSQAFAAALTFSPELALQRAQLDLAHAEVLRARQRPNPVLSLTPEKVISATTISPWVVALSLVWPARTAGKRALEIEQALAMDDASLLNGADAVWKLRATVRSAFCAVEIATARRDLVNEEMRLRNDLAARLVKQADAGIASRYDSMRAQMEGTQSLQLARQGEADLRAARHDLADATGVPAAEIERQSIGATCLPPAALTIPPAASLQESAIAGRLDLRAKLAEFRAVDAAYRAEIRRRVPDINLGPGYTYDQGDRKLTFTVSTELPLFSHNGAAIAKARAERDRVIAEVNKLQWAIRAGLDRALDLLELSRQQYADAQQVVQQSEAILGRDRERVAAGELDQTAIVTSQIAVLVTRADALTAEGALLDAIAALEASTQTPLVPPFFDAAAATRVLAPAPAGKSK